MERPPVEQKPKLEHPHPSVPGVPQPNPTLQPGTDNVYLATSHLRLPTPLLSGVRKRVGNRLKQWFRLCALLIIRPSDGGGAAEGSKEMSPNQDKTPAGELDLTV